MGTIETDCSRSSAGCRLGAATRACLASMFWLSVPFAAHATDHVVTALSNMTFSPAAITINAGDTVTFENGGGTHNAVSTPGSVTVFRCANGCDGSGGNGNLSSAAWSATVTFPTAGTINYYCQAHGSPGAGMSGTITVKAVPTLSILDASVTEGDSGTKLATFSIRLSMASSSTVKFNVATSNDTATAGSDYVAKSLVGQAIPAGATSLAFSVTINGDRVFEPNETFKVTVSNVVGAALTDGVAVGTITNDDPTPRGDFNADGKSDLLWRYFVSGANTIWKSANSATKQTVTAISDLSWIVAGVGDVNADRKFDIVWRNTSSGSGSVWYSANSATKLVLTALTDQHWKIVGVADFDGDGKADLLWRNYSTGGNTIWKSANSATKQVVTTVSDLSFIVAGVGDLNGDKKSDIVWRNSRTGSDSVWYSANSATKQTLTTMADQNWKIVGVADFDGDGKSDLLWRNTATGANAIWRSGSSATPQTVASQATAWVAAATGDYNGDAKADIVWRNTSNGANTLWPSASMASAQALASVTDQQWKILP
jgi:plastocyanin